MNYLIIESHPYKGSFNAAVAELVKETAMQQGHSVYTIDLVVDGFNPVMGSEDLRLWGQGQSSDPLVKKYQNEIEKADMLVFSFPVWWGTMPAILKGFCDKVLLPGWAYKYDDKGEMMGLLTDKKAVVITTMETQVEYFKDYFKDPVEGGFIKDTIETCGMKVAKFFQIDKIVSGGRDYAEGKLEEIKGWMGEVS